MTGTRASLPHVLDAWRERDFRCTHAAQVHVTTFGYLHGAPPTANVTLDLRTHFKDPHVRPELRPLTAADAPVREAVLTTPGIAALIGATLTLVGVFLSGPTRAPVTVAVGVCGWPAPGRHRRYGAGRAADRLWSDHGIDAPRPRQARGRPLTPDEPERTGSTMFGSRKNAAAKAEYAKAADMWAQEARKERKAAAKYRKPSSDPAADRYMIKHHETNADICEANAGDLRRMAK